jgi:hypothetical protein
MRGVDRCVKSVNLKPTHILQPPTKKQQHMATTLKHTGNLDIWLRVFSEVMKEDPSLKLDGDTQLNFDGADTTMHPEVHVLGVFKLGSYPYNEFLIITFMVNASWDEISDIKFECSHDITRLKLPSAEELEVIRFHDRGIAEVEGG